MTAGDTEHTWTADLCLCVTLSQCRTPSQELFQYLKLKMVWRNVLFSENKLKHELVWPQHADIGTLHQTDIAFLSTCQVTFLHAAAGPVTTVLYIYYRWWRTYILYYQTLKLLYSVKTQIMNSLYFVHIHSSLSKLTNCRFWFSEK